MTLYRQVTGSGPPNAKIVIVGEAPAEEEVKQGRPFVGPSGRVLRREIQNAKLNESEIRFENLCEHKAPHNKIEAIPQEEMILWEADLKQRLKKLNPVVVVTCGAVPTQVFLPDTKISEQHCYITKLKDSTSWLVPSYHPSYVVRGNWRDSFWIRLALSKAKAISEGTSLPDHNHDITISPSLSTVSNWFADFANFQILACDIEKTRTNEISCISFATSPDRAISIPFIIDGQSYWSPEEEKRIWMLINTMLCRDIPKVFHNFIFDVLVLSYFGVEVNGDIHDTMTLAHLLHPELQKSLGDVGRLHTWGPEWKSKGEWRDVKNWEEFWTYNAMDSVRTLECFEKQRALLQQCGRWDFYKTHLLKLVEPVYQMCARGWNIDHSGVEKEKGEVQAIMSDLHAKIDTYAKGVGIDGINPRSSKQMKEFAVAMGWKIPTNKGSETMDETARAKLYIKYKHPIFPALDTYMEHATYSSRYLNATLDADKRFRFSITIPGTVEARFSSSQTPWDTGGNSQNIPERFRNFIIPDPGKILINTDLDRADARVVAWLSKDPTMNRILDQGLDMHVMTANGIFGEDITKLPKDEYERKRKLGKKANHALNYGMQARKFKDDTLKDTGIALSLEEAQEIVDGYFQTYAGLKAWHLSIQSQIKQTRRLTSPHGRVRTFLGIVNDKMFRDAYAWIPPTTVADSINTTMLRFIELCRENSVDAQVLGQTHDSLLIQADERVLDTVTQLIDIAMKSSIFYIHNKPCCLNWDIMVGLRWGDMKPYERKN